MVEASELQWTSVSLQELTSSNLRFEASVYGIEGKRARQMLDNLKLPLKPLCGPDGLAIVFHRPRFKRVFVEFSNLPIFQPSQITDIKPRPLLFVSDKTETDLEALRVKAGQVLLTCSGTVGVCSFVSSSYDEKLFSHDLLRIDARKDEYSGYIYAFLKSKVGEVLVKTNNYGAVVQHIEPSHLESLLIPVPSDDVIKEIDRLVRESYKKRDESNDLIDQATHKLVKVLGLPSMRELGDRASGIDSHTVRFDALKDRFEANYHHTKIDRLVKILKDKATSVVTVQDAEVSKEIILPGRFKRVYVEEDQGVTFFGGKQIFELDPSNKKYLSLTHHEARISDQLTLREDMVLVTCSGTIGRVQLTPKHWDGWTANQHVMRIVPNSPELSGYLYIWLQSEYGEALIKRHKYGAVVDELDDKQMGQVEVPLIDPGQMSDIGNLALDANRLRYEAYLLEREAIRLLEGSVLAMD